jgi:hypothetical protein
MRAMIFGDTASGKSTFAENLGELTGTPVVHLDQIMDSIGRDDSISIGEVIHEEADKDAWIIEGNAFTKDPTYRIERSELVFAFDFSPVRAMTGHILRYGRIKSGLEQRKGSEDDKLNLSYFVPYIFQNYPPRKRSAIAHAESLDKETVIFNKRHQTSQYLAELI